MCVCLAVLSESRGQIFTLFGPLDVCLLQVLYQKANVSQTFQITFCVPTAGVISESKRQSHCLDHFLCACCRYYTRNHMLYVCCWYYIRKQRLNLHTIQTTCCIFAAGIISESTGQIFTLFRPLAVCHFSDINCTKRSSPSLERNTWKGFVDPVFL